VFHVHAGRGHWRTLAFDLIFQLSALIARWLTAFVPVSSTKQVHRNFLTRPVHLYFVPFPQAGDGRKDTICQTTFAALLSRVTPSALGGNRANGLKNE
jgi:hypothetical protein